MVILLLLLGAPAAHADTSIAVDGEAIVIDGYKRSPSSSGGEPAPPCVEYVLVPTPGVLPADSIVEIPCRESPRILARIGEELRERAVRYLPPQRPGLSPPRAALVNLPVIAFAGQEPVVLHATVLGEHVTIWLSPSYRWRWGDGTSTTTSLAGRGYPDKSITHTYNRACTCTVRLQTSWQGRWAFDDGEGGDLSLPTQESTLILQVRQAPVRFTR